MYVSKIVFLVSIECRIKINRKQDKKVDRCD